LGSEQHRKLDLQTHQPRPMVDSPDFFRTPWCSRRRCSRWDLSDGFRRASALWKGKRYPNLPWAAARKKEKPGYWIDRDPELKCFQPGIPRAMYMPHPFQIIQSATKIMMVYEFANAERTIHLNKMEPYPNVAFMGYASASGKAIRS